MDIQKMHTDDKSSDIPTKVVYGTKFLHWLNQFQVGKTPNYGGIDRKQGCFFS